MILISCGDAHILRSPGLDVSRFASVPSATEAATASADTGSDSGEYKAKKEKKRADLRRTLATGCSILHSLRCLCLTVIQVICLVVLQGNQACTSQAMSRRCYTKDATIRCNMGKSLFGFYMVAPPSEVIVAHLSQH